MINKKKWVFVALIIACSPLLSNAQKGELYPNFPESFEQPGEILPGYKKGNIKLGSGEWYFLGTRIDSTGNDKPSSGKYAARMVGSNSIPALLQMNFDLPDGASKVSVSYSVYGAKMDKSSKFALEYSIDGGKKWMVSGTEILAKSKTIQSVNFDLNLKGKVRFRISKLGIGKASEEIENGRLCIDDFAVYKN